MSILAGDRIKYDMADLSARLPRLDTNKSKLEDVYYEILDDEDLSEEQEKMYTKNYETSIADYHDILVAWEKINSKPASSPSSQPSTSSTLTTVLPKIALPKFSSKVEDWP